MKMKIMLVTATLIVAGATSVFALNQASAAQSAPEMMFVDLLFLQPGVEDAQVEEYFSRIAPIVAKHGLKRVGSFKVTHKMRGSIEPDFLNLWVVAGPQTFEGIFSDEEYKQHVPFRNSTFDMERANMFMLTPTYTTVKFPSAEYRR